MTILLPSDVHRAIVFCIKQRVFRRGTEYFKNRLFNISSEGGCWFFCGSHVSAAVMHNGSVLLLSAALADVSLVQDFLSALRAWFCQLGQTPSTLQRLPVCSVELKSRRVLLMKQCEKIRLRLKDCFRRSAG